MKTGLTLTELAQELERQTAAKRDFVADTRTLEFSVPSITERREGFALGMDLDGSSERFPLLPHTHSQLASRLNIPRVYWDRMMEEAPALLKSNVDHWFKERPERRMVRTMFGNARAFLSERYRPLDNSDLAEAILPKLLERRLDIQSCQITDQRLYIKAFAPDVEAAVKVGDTVRAGICISNSEVGCGSLSVEPYVLRLVCLNGMKVPMSGLKKYHVGRKTGDNIEDAREFFRDETRAADDKAFFLKARDTVDALLDPERFDIVVGKLRDATERHMEGDPVKAIEVAQKRFRWNEGESSSILRHLIQGADLSQYGLVQAVTRAAEDVEDYDRATDLERDGGNVLELNKRDWSQIAAAA